MRISKKDVASILIFIALILAFVLLVNNITNKIGRASCRERVLFLV